MERNYQCDRKYSAPIEHSRTELGSGAPAPQLPPFARGRPAGHGTPHAPVPFTEEFCLSRHGRSERDLGKSRRGEHGARLPAAGPPAPPRCARTGPSRSAPPGSARGCPPGPAAARRHRAGAARPPPAPAVAPGPADGPSLTGCLSSFTSFRSCSTSIFSLSFSLRSSMLIAGMVCAARARREGGDEGGRTKGYRWAARPSGPEPPVGRWDGGTAGRPPPARPRPHSPGAAGLLRGDRFLPTAPGTLPRAARPLNSELIPSNRITGPPGTALGTFRLRGPSAPHPAGCRHPLPSSPPVAEAAGGCPELSPLPCSFCTSVLRGRVRLAC